MKILFRLALILIIFPLNSQTTERPPTRVEMVEEIHGVFKKILSPEAVIDAHTAKPCHFVLQSMIDKQKQSLIYSRTEILAAVHALQDHMDADSFFQGNGFKKGVFENLTDKAIFIIHNSVGLSEFVKEFTGKNLDEMNEQLQENLRFYYVKMTSLAETWFSPEYKKQIGNVENGGECLGNAKFSFKVKEWNYPKAVWYLKIDVDMSCACHLEHDSTYLANTKYSYTATAEGTLPGKTMTMTNPINPTLTVNTLECCANPELSYTPFETTDINENNDVDWVASNYIETQAGIATGKDEETLFCVGLGVMFHLTDLAGNPLFVGVNASFHTASFSPQDFSSNNLRIGPSVEYRLPFGSTSTDWIIGAQGGYNFGSSESAGFVTDISGIDTILYTGLNVPVNDSFAIGVLVNLVSYSNLTFTNNDGFENKVTNTGFSFNKGSAAVSLRINLGENNKN